VILTLEHEGANAGMLEWIQIHSWHSAFGFFCNIQTHFLRDR